MSLARQPFQMYSDISSDRPGDMKQERISGLRPASMQEIEEELDSRFPKCQVCGGDGKKKFLGISIGECKACGGSGEG